jgi:hypothetical protein
MPNERGNAKKSLLLAVLLIVIPSYALWSLVQAKQFRRHPTAAKLMAILNGQPGNLLTRLLVFRGGTRSYRNDLHHWLYHEDLGEARDVRAQDQRIADTWANRWILKNDLSQMSMAERVESLRGFPLRLSDDDIPLLVLGLDMGYYHALIPLGRINTQASTNAYRQWVTQNLVDQDNKELFRRVAPYLVRYSIVKPSTLFAKYWSRLNLDEQADITKQVAIYLVAQSDATNDVFEWFQRLLDQQGTAYSDGELVLLEQFVSIPRTSREAVRLAMRSYSRIRSDQVTDFLWSIERKTAASTHNLKSAAAGEVTSLSSAIAEEWFHQASVANPEFAVESLRFIAGIALEKGERLAQPVLEQPDSELRKGIIVVLVCNGSLLGDKYLDDAFSGLAPRRTFFSRIDRYEHSNAAEMYRRISGHDYEETGKTWPPSRIIPGRLADEAPEWKSFIDRYPWFPGTDDAFYRMAYSLFATGDFRGAKAAISDYMNRELPDRDATPYIMFLLKEIAVSEPPDGTDAILLRNLKTIAVNPLAAVMFDPAPDVGSLIAATEWFLENPKFIVCLNSTPEQLRVLRQITLIIERDPIDLRLSSIMSVTKDDPLILRKILTARFFTPKYARDYIHDDDQKVSASLSDAALRVNQVLTGERTGGNGEVLAAAELALVFPDIPCFTPALAALKAMPIPIGAFPPVLQSRLGRLNRGATF